MLMPCRSCRVVHGAPPARQRGVILMISMIVLVAMTLAGIALVRSLDTSNIIAGNLAFQQAAVNAGDIGTETAVTWLQNNVAGTTLQQSIPAQGYVASRQDPAAGQSWEAFWTNTLVPAGQVVTLPQDSSTGNTVSYTIQRMCAQVGDPAVPLTDCSVLQTTGSSAGSSKGSGVIALQYNSQVYYRITSRIVGPRNTVAFVQTIVAL